MKVLVYGTLKRGGRFHGALENSTYLGDVTLSGVRMFDLGSFPGIKYSGGANDFVHCEQYEVDDTTLAVLDRIEGYYADDEANSLYIRHQEAEGYVYVYNRDITPHDYDIPDGVWQN